MKKTIRKVALCLAVLGMGMSVSSCDSDSISDILNTIIGNLIGTNTTYTYTGTGTSECLNYQTVSGESGYVYVNTNKDTSISSQSVTLQSSGTTGTLTVPAYTDGKVTVAALSLYNLTMTTNTDKTQTALALSDNSTIDGSITVGGTSYTASNVYITTATATSGALDLYITYYFGDADSNGNYPYAINYKYEGTAVTTE